MTLVDPIGDMFTRIRNGQMRNLISVNIPASKFRSKILEILKIEGYINNFYLENNDNNKKVIKVNLKYYEDNDIKPSENLLFTISFVPLTNYEYAADDLVN